ncbi:MAG TPA: M23 family peptidase, partial [Sphingomonadaceae bacterium]|nr:M23 family peptidase [Sphingomonadaceae bacterium]
MKAGGRASFLAALFLLTGCGDSGPPPLASSPPSARPAPEPSPLPVALPVVQPLPASIEFGGELTQGGWMRGTLPVSAVEAALDGKSFPFAADGSFFAAFDRDAGTSARLTA